MIITSPSLPQTSAKVSVRSLPRTPITPSRAVNSPAPASSIAAAASNSRSRASSAAARTAGPTDAVVIEPQEFDAKGSRSVSPRIVRTSAARAPSVSAAIWAMTVREPVPRSCAPVSTSAVPSRLSRTVA